MARGKKGRFIHISGTGVLNDMSKGPGNPTPKVYDDIKDVLEITSLPMTALHRDVDAAVIAAGKEYDIPTAIVCPPMIHGVGSGPGKKRSIQIPYLMEAIVGRGKAFTVEEGNNIWDRKFLCRTLPDFTGPLLIKYRHPYPRPRKRFCAPDRRSHQAERWRGLLGPRRLLLR